MSTLLCPNRYGVAGYGTPGTKVAGTPDTFNGARSRMYVEMDTISITSTTITTQMRAAQQEASACSGDSGSAVFPINPDTDGKYILLGGTSSGDTQCRATNTVNVISVVSCFHRSLPSGL